MAGYRIEFTGGLVDRRDVPQVTTSNSLGATITYSPSSWENPSPGDPFGDFNPRGPADVLPNTYNASIYAGGGPITNTGTTVQINGPYYWSASTANLPVETYNWEYRIRSTGGSTQPDRQAWVSDTTGTRTISSGRSGTLLYSTTFSNSGVYQVFSGTATITNPNQWILFEFGFVSPPDPRFFELDYLRITQANTTTITESTQTAGAAPTGGTATTATPDTIVDGVSGTSGPPLPMDLTVSNGAQVAAKASVTEPAQSTEDSQTELRNKRIITATDTTLSASVTGLDTTNIIKQEGTSLEVIALKDSPEN